MECHWWRLIMGVGICVASGCLTLGLGMGGAIAQTGPITTPPTTTPQPPPVIADQTLPNPSDIQGDNQVWQIGGGTAAGANLFHSFATFSVPTDQTVRFVPGSEIDRIIARVTGTGRSRIDGVLASEGSASLFLVNPNGIVMGPNAQLQVGGSFIGSTAESVLFADGTQFGTGVNTTTAPLLTATMPLGLQFGGGRSGEIIGRGRGPSEPAGLTVLPGRTLGLVGRSLDLSGIGITVPSGRLELGAVTQGTVGLDQTASGLWQLDYGAVEGFGSLDLQGGSLVTGIGVLPQESGAIALAGEDITVSRSQVLSLASETAAGPPIFINGSGTLSLLANPEDPVLSTGIFSAVPVDGTQVGGAIAIATDQLVIRDGGRLQSSTQGSGTAGDIAVRSRQIDLDGFTRVGPMDTLSFDNTAQSGIVSFTTAAGDSGRLMVNADQATLTRGALIETGTTETASGRARSVDVTVMGPLTLVGVNPENAVQTSRVTTLVFGDGAGGAVTVRARSVSLADGAQLGSVTGGRGAGGNLQLSVDGLLLVSGENLARPGQGAGSTVATIAFGSGRSGDIAIDAGQVRLEDGASLGTQALNNFLGVTVIPEAGSAESGNVLVRADVIDLVGTSAFNPAVPSALASATFGSGDAGSTVVEANELRVLNGATLSSSTLISFLGVLEQPNAGQGNGGDLTVRVRDRIEVSGTGSGSELSSTLGTNSVSFGDAGKTQIQTRELIIRDGGLVTSAAFALGNAGELAVAAESILIEGQNANGLPSQITASALTPPSDLQAQFGIPAGSSGDTGLVTVVADRIEIRDRGQISVQHDGSGNAGTLILDAGLITLAGGGQIRANTVAGTGGSAVVNARSLQLRDTSQVSVAAGGAGNGGNLTLATDTLALLDDSTIRANAVQGQGGNINIVSQGLFLGPNSQVTASSQLGIDGTVQVDRPEIDPGSELLQLPTAVVDPSDRISTDCLANRENRFVVQGRGSNLLTGEPSVLWEDLRLDLGEEVEEVDAADPITAAMLDHPRSEKVEEPEEPIELVEAQGWRSHPNGTVTLTYPGQTSHRASCQSLSASQQDSP